MGTRVTIGVWHERAAREERRCPSYYAADYEVLRTYAGDYPAEVMFETGYTVPMPYWLLVSVTADRIDGALYSGFGGNNFSRKALALEPAPLRVQMYAYQIRELVAAGTLTLFPGFEWLLSDVPWQHPDAPKTWDDLKKPESGEGVK